MGTRQQQPPALLGFNPLALHVSHLLYTEGAKLVRGHAEILEGWCFACLEFLGQATRCYLDGVNGVIALFSS